MGGNVMKILVTGAAGVAPDLVHRVVSGQGPLLILGERVKSPRPPLSEGGSESWN
jgi:hypothetical protein